MQIHILPSRLPGIWHNLHGNGYCTEFPEIGLRVVSNVALWTEYKLILILVDF